MRKISPPCQATPRGSGMQTRSQARTSLASAFCTVSTGRIDIQRDFHAAAAGDDRTGGVAKPLRWVSTCFRMLAVYSNGLTLLGRIDQQEEALVPLLACVARRSWPAKVCAIFKSRGSERISFSALKGNDMQRILGSISIADSSNAEPFQLKIHDIIRIFRKEWLSDVRVKLL